MAHPRTRNDSSPTVYHVKNTFLGEPGELSLDDRQMRRLSLIIRQTNRLYCVDIISFKVSASGYSLVCSAPAALPSSQDLRYHFIQRFGARRQVPDFDDPEVWHSWALRLRNFSCLIKDIQQRFTRWYNQVVRNGRRRGTLWKSRFASYILKTARRALDVGRRLLNSAFSPQHMHKLQGQQWRKSGKGQLFLRDSALPALTATGDLTLLFAYVLLDSFSHLSRAPFPLRLLRNMIGRRLDQIN